jgi:hypothetical protein
MTPSTEVAETLSSSEQCQKGSYYLLIDPFGIIGVLLNGDRRFHP